MGVELRFITPNSQLFYTFSLLRNLKIGCGSLKKVQINLASCSPCTIFAASEGRNPWIKNAFLAFTHTVKSPVSNKRGGNNATLILFVYSTSTAHAVPHKVYTTAWGICFSVHSLNGVWRYQLYDELDKSLRFSCFR